MPPIGRNPPPKKGKSGSSFRPLSRRGGDFVHCGGSRGARQVNARGSIGGQAHQGPSPIGGSWSRGDLSTHYL